MRILYLVIAIMLLWGCASAPARKPEAVPTPSPQKPPAQGIVITSRVLVDTLEWGVPYDLPVDVVWVSAHRMPVRLAVDAPGWLKVKIDTAETDTTAKAVIHITPVPAWAPLGNISFAVEARSDSLPEPARKEFNFFVRRRSGNFARMAFDTLPRVCDSVCARISAYGGLSFYDLRKGGSCADTSELSEIGRLGTQGFALSRKGFAFGPDCRVAAVNDISGVLSFVNFGLSPRLPAGAVLLTLRGTSECWLSPDNTLVLVVMSGAVLPYDIASGRMLGGPCQLPSDTVTVRMESGRILRAGACRWELP